MIVNYQHQSTQTCTDSCMNYIHSHIQPNPVKTTIHLLHLLPCSPAGRRTRRRRRRRTGADALLSNVGKKVSLKAPQGLVNLQEITHFIPIWGWSISAGPARLHYPQTSCEMSIMCVQACEWNGPLRRPTAFTSQQWAPYPLYPPWGCILRHLNPMY